MLVISPSHNNNNDKWFKFNVNNQQWRVKMLSNIKKGWKFSHCCTCACLRLISKELFTDRCILNFQMALPNIWNFDWRTNSDRRTLAVILTYWLINVRIYTKLDTILFRYIKTISLFNVNNRIDHWKNNGKYGYAFNAPLFWQHRIMVGNSEYIRVILETTWPIGT